MIRFIKNLFRKSKQQEPLKLFAVEARLMLDENTEITKIACTIYAKSKKDAKFQITNRAFVKVGAVVNKAQINTYLKNKKA